MVPLETLLAPDTPWWAVLIYCSLSALIPVIVILITRGNSKKEISDTKAVVDLVKEQVANTHSTNLRDDIDSLKDRAGEAASNAQLAKEAAHRMERLAEDMAKSLRAIEHSIDRRDNIHAQETRDIRDDVAKVGRNLEMHLEASPRILDEALRRHQADCPALPSGRNQAKLV